MLSNNDKTRKWFNLLPSSIEFFPASHLRTKTYFPLLTAILLSLVWGGLIIQDGLKAHRSFQALTTNENSAPSNLSDTAIAQSAPINIATITTLNLFGKVEIKPAEIDAATLPTASNLKLVGLFASSVSGTSRSLIAEEGKPAKSYAEGDPLPGNAKIFRIENDCVIVQRGDQYEKLALPGSSIGKASAPVHSFAEIAQAQLQTASSAPPPTVSKNEADGNAGPQSIYRALDARLAALKKKKS